MVLFVIMTASLFSQSWNNVVQTTIPFDNLVGLDLVTNKDGNHILVNNHHVSGGFPVVHTYTLKYYLLNSSGSVIRSYTLENFQGGGGIQFASIDGADDRIYVVYKLWNGNQIKTRKSVNAGKNWSNDIQDINIGSNTCNHIDITFGKDDNALHVVWATQDAGSDYKTYYKRLASDNSWSNTQEVTDGSNVGGFPTVSKSQNRVHVSYNTGNAWSPEVNLGDAKSRDKYINTWQTPQLVFPTESFRERIHAGNSKLFDFYYKLETGMGQYRSDLYVKERNLNGTSWSSPVLLKTHASVYEIVSASNTFNGNSHIVYEISGGVGYRNYNGSSWGSEFTVGSGYNSPRISSISNDLFVAWGKDWPTKYIHYRQFNSAPLVPQNLAVTSNVNNNPYLTWTANREPDISYYEIWKKGGNEGGDWHLKATTSNTYYTDNSETVVTGPPQANEGYAYYKIKAVDLGSLKSDFSNQVQIRVNLEPLSKFFSGNTNGNSPLEFGILQNYPNPFNPSTRITYAVSEDAKVTLKVYDILGVEVAELVNETKPAGFYEVTFNALNISSGIYIYRITALKGERVLFNESKRMTLLK